MKEATAVVKDFLDASGAAATIRTETVYAYHTDFGGDSRISGCEVRLRACGGQVEINIVLPVSVQHLEYKGVSDCIAAMNEEVGRGGCFDLDRLAGRIMYRCLLREADEDALKEAVNAALESVAVRSDGLMKMVCDESSAAQRRELQRLKREERANRGDSPLTSMLKKCVAALKAKGAAKNAVECLPVPEEAEAVMPADEAEATAEPVETEAAAECVEYEIVSETELDAETEAPEESETVEEKEDNE